MRLKEILLKNIGWKIGGLILALALWFHLATERIYEKSYPADIEVIGLSDNLRVEKIVPPDLEVTVTGTGKQLIKLSISNELMLKANLAAVKNPGVYEHRFTIADLRLIDPTQYRRISFPGDAICSIYIAEKI